jgi:hypothetical protein
LVLLWHLLLLVGRLRLAWLLWVRCRLHLLLACHQARLLVACACSRVCLGCVHHPLFPCHQW